MKKDKKKKPDTYSMCLGFRRINMAMVFGQSQSAVHSFVFINTKKYVKIPPENGLHRDFLRNCLPHEENSRMLLAKEFVNHVVLFLILKKKKTSRKLFILFTSDARGNSAYRMVFDASVFAPTEMLDFFLRITLKLFTTQLRLLTTLSKEVFENILGKGENAGNQHFLLFPKCFLAYQRHESPFKQN